MNTIEEQTVEEKLLSDLGKSIDLDQDKVSRLAAAINARSLELYGLLAEGTAKEYVIGHTVIIENMAGDLLQACIRFRQDYVRYTTALEAHNSVVSA
jgi:hypothetical protein